MALKISCICSNSSKNNSDDLILCTCCSHYAHFSCYQLTSFSAYSLQTPFLCILCKLFLNDPFIEITDLIIKPYLLPLKKHIEQYQKFELTYPQSNDLRNEIKKLNFLALKVNAQTLAIEWPFENLFFWVNNKTLDFERKNYGEILWKNLRNSNEFNICCLEGLDEPVVFLMFMSRKQEINEIIRFISQRSLFKNSANYRERFLNILKAQKLKVFKINDVFSGKRMSFPGRGRFCNHLDCFDIENYLKINENKSLEPTFQWKCPICRQTVLWNELDLDLYVNEILNLIEKKQINEGKYIFFDEFNIWEVFHGDENALEEKLLLNDQEKQNPRLLFPEHKLQKIRENKKIFDIFLKFKTFYFENAVRGFLSYQNIDKFIDFSNLSDAEFYQILQASGILKKIYQENAIRMFSTQKQMKSFKSSSIEEFFMENSSGLIVNVSFFWAKNLKQIFLISSRIMCKNIKTFPDICLAMELLLLFSYEIKMKKLENVFELNQEERIGGILGILFGFFIEEYHYDEGKVGKMLYLLWNNILEFGLNESLTQNNYKERIEEMSDLLINFTAKWSFEKMVNFLLNLYEPPKKLKNQENQVLYFKIMVHYFTILFKKKTNNEISNPEIKVFLRRWDRERTMDGFLSN